PAPGCGLRQRETWCATTSQDGPEHHGGGEQGGGQHQAGASRPHLALRRAYCQSMGQLTGYGGSALLPAKHAS
ncbi:MAG: hypothetical protein OXI23_10610, partial [Gemmatimonadota bacterium]|nr:hypothetical protein [Gemmatimonadota bacterium]